MQAQQLDPELGRDFDYFAHKAPEAVLERREEAATETNQNIVAYTATPTGSRFHMDTEPRVKAVMGGIAAGKSVMCVFDMILKMQRQAPDAFGRRRSRWAVIRGTYGQLKTTTLETFRDWVPPHICRIVDGAPIRGYFSMRLDDGTKVESVIYFMALDKPQQVSNLLSLELTGAWINEAAEIRNSSILKQVLSRCGRYPKKSTSPITWFGVIMDYNPPQRGAWLHTLFEKNCPHGYTLYKIPPPLLAIPDPDDPDDTEKVQFVINPDAENVSNLDVGSEYWLGQIAGAKGDWAFITRFLLGDYPVGESGNPVFPLFSSTKHVKPNLQAYRGSYLIVSFDFGLYNACVFGQYVDGAVQVLEEFEDPDASLFDFMDEKILPALQTKYSGFRLIATGDPAGNQRSANNPEKRNAIRILKEYGFTYVNCSSNSFQVRRDAVNWLLRRNRGFYVGENCEHLIQAMAGGYQWKKTVTGERVMEPVKDHHSHIVDALQYLAMYFRKPGQQVFVDEFESVPNRLQQSLAAPAGIDNSGGSSNDGGYLWV